jgi:hypothetical protein
MKLKNGFILREVAGQIVVLPSGDDLDLNMMITLNEVGKFIWLLLENETDEASIVTAILREYDVDRTTAESAVAGFIRKLNEYGFLAD